MGLLSKSSFKTVNSVFCAKTKLFEFGHMTENNRIKDVKIDKTKN